MSRRFIIMLIIIGVFGLSIIMGPWKNRQQSRFRFPAEFEKQQAIWLQWPSEIYNLNDFPVNPTMVKLIKALSSYIRVNLLTQSTTEINQLKKLFQVSGVKGSRVHYYLVPHFSIWTRDVGPIFLKNHWGSLKVVDFGFNNYSRNQSQTYIQTEGQVDQRVGKLLHLPVIQAEIISEGGAIETNGRGILMITEAVALKRNPKLTKAQIEEEYRRTLGIQKVIWLKKGLAEDDAITGGHINEIARFADPGTILLAQVLPSEKDLNQLAHESYLRLEINFQILRNSTDQNGKHFRIIRLPLPPTFYREAEFTKQLPVRSYLNFVITNGAVFIQTYWQPGRPQLLKKIEQQVINKFQRVFPGRKIIGIDSEAINRWGGGLHCITQPMPAPS